MMRTKKIVPIFDVTVYLVIADTIETGRAVLPKKFREIDVSGCKGACLVTGTRDFALIFTPDELSQDVISHEVRHLVDEIMIYIEEVMHWGTETCSLLQGYFTKWVNQFAEKAGLPFV